MTKKLEGIEKESTIISEDLKRLNSKAETSYAWLIPIVFYVFFQMIN